MYTKEEHTNVQSLNQPSDLEKKSHDCVIRYIS